MVTVNGSTAVVTGGQRGLGLGETLVGELVKRGTARCMPPPPHPSPPASGIGLPLDATGAESLAALVETANDEAIAVNSASFDGARSLLGSGLVTMRAIFETNYFGTQCLRTE